MSEDKRREEQEAKKRKDDDVPQRSNREEEHEQDMLDEGIEESFPASDPPSISRRSTSR